MPYALQLFATVNLMAASEEENRRQGLRLQLARARARIDSGTEAADRLKLNRTTYLHHENGTRSLKQSAANYAAAFDVPAEWLIWGLNPPDWLTEEQRQATAAVEKPTLKLVKGSALSPPVGRPALRPAIGLREVVRRIPVIGEVQAGNWQEPASAELNLEAGVEALIASGCETIALDVLGYERATLFALRVIGPSMNLVYPEGRYVVVAPAAEAGVQDRDVVVIRRNRGGLIETTLKEMVVGEGGRAELWPRSTDERYKDPILLFPRGGDQDRPEIIGVVVADYARRPRQGLPAVFQTNGDDHAE